MAHILVVEDDKDIANLIETHLRLEGFDVTVASEGIEAIRKMESSLPDLVVLDIMLPRVDGWEVLLKMKKSYPTKDIPVIMLSAKSEDISKITAFREGADDYVTKPFSPDELVARIKAVLRRAVSVEAREEEVKAQRIPVEFEERKLLLKPAEVIFVESQEAQTYLHTYSGVYPSHLSLTDLEFKLPREQFFRCHRSYLVNLDKVKEIISQPNRTCLVVVGDEKKSQVPVSRRSIKELKERLGLRF